MAITHVVVRGLNIDKNEFEVITEWDVQAGEADPERRGHEVAAEWLNKSYPGWWCYRYATLKNGITVKTPGTLPDDRYGDGKGIDGVVDMNLIANDGFRGQFQWNKQAWDEKRLGLGGYVPAKVTCTDPVKEAEYERRLAEQRAEDARKAAEMKAKIDALPGIQYKDGGEALWQSWIDANTDGYGRAVMIYAEQWMRLLQAEINPQIGEALKITSNDEFVRGVRMAFADAAQRTSHEADTVGLSGFQYGVAVNIVSQVWIHGEELRRRHNKEWGAPKAEGTVNPALLTIEVKEK